MKTRTLSAMLFMLITLAGCSTVSVVSDYDSTIPVAGYKTYNWTDDSAAKNVTNVLPENPLILKRIKSSVDRELATKGYALESSGPADFSVALYASTRKLAYYDPPPAGFYYYRGFHGRYGFYDPFWWGGPYVRYYEEGTLGVDIFDNRTGRLAWRGVGRGILDDHRNGDELQRQIDEAVAKILAEFPPKPKQ
ncbi:MAG: DUF4136 domain-containing protein [Chlorobiaceae bacterium]|nr:DUF4136 domain-containing protein [Chlorobiaceae bacterium]